jgi:cytoskeletal protein CcmA (bactofilin family)
LTLFGKKDKHDKPRNKGKQPGPLSDPGPTSQPASTTNRPQVKTEPAPRNADRSFASANADGPSSAGTEFGPTVKIDGEIEGDENVTINGRLEGMLNLKKDLVVGPSGHVIAEIHANAVIIHGSVNGNVVADTKVEITSNGKLDGNIKSPKIQIHEGAHFKGHVDMSSSPVMEKVPGPAAGEGESETHDTGK